MLAWLREEVERLSEQVRWLAGKPYRPSREKVPPGQLAFELIEMLTGAREKDASDDDEEEAAAEAAPEPKKKPKKRKRRGRELPGTGLDRDVGEAVQHVDRQQTADADALDTTRPARVGQGQLQVGGDGAGDPSANGALASDLVVFDVVESSSDGRTLLVSLVVDEGTAGRVFAAADDVGVRLSLRGRE